MQDMIQEFQLKLQQLGLDATAMEGDKNRAIEARRLDLEQGNFAEAARHNLVIETLGIRQQALTEKTGLFNMVTSLLEKPLVFAMYRQGGGTFGQISPEFASLDRIPVPRENTEQNLARWQAGSQLAKQGPGTQFTQAPASK